MRHLNIYAVSVALSVLIFGSACSKVDDGKTGNSSVSPALSVPNGAASSGVALKYEGKIVRQKPANRGKEDGWYLVKDGKRKWIPDGTWLVRNGFKAEEVIEISAPDFAAMPEDPIPVK